MLSAAFEYEVKGQFNALNQNNWSRGAPYHSYIKILQREDEQAAWQASLTEQLTQPEVKTHLGDSSGILSWQLTCKLHLLA